MFGFDIRAKGRIKVLDEFVDLCFRAFGKDLDAAIGEVADPACEMKFLGPSLGGEPETDPLDNAGIEDMGLNHMNIKSGRWDLNPRPQRPERCALAKLRYFPYFSIEEVNNKNLDLV